MSHLNRVIVTGNLCKDPELRYAGSTQTPVSDLRVAINRAWKSAKGEKREDTVFIDVVAWGRTAETAVQYLKKGRQILVEGRLQQSDWTATDGRKMSRIRIVCDRLVFLPQGERSSAEPAPPAESGAEPEESFEERPASIPA